MLIGILNLSPARRFLFILVVILSTRFVKIIFFVCFSLIVFDRFRLLLYRLSGLILRRSHIVRRANFLCVCLEGEGDLIAFSLNFLENFKVFFQ